MLLGLEEERFQDAPAVKEKLEELVIKWLGQESRPPELLGEVATALSIWASIQRIGPSRRRRDRLRPRFRDDETPLVIPDFKACLSKSRIAPHGSQAETRQEFQLSATPWCFFIEAGPELAGIGDLGISMAIPWAIMIALRPGMLWPCSICRKTTGSIAGRSFRPSLAQFQLREHALLNRTLRWRASFSPTTACSNQLCCGRMGTRSKAGSY